MTENSTVKPEILDTKEVFHGTIFDVSVDTIREGNATYHRDVVHHPGGAGAVAVFDGYDDRTCAAVQTSGSAIPSRNPGRQNRGARAS